MVESNEANYGKNRVKETHTMGFSISHVTVKNAIVMDCPGTKASSINVKN